MLSPRSFVLFVVCVSLLVVARLTGQSWPLTKVERSLGLLTVVQGSGNCTVFSINEQDGYWIGAKHCLFEGMDHLINGQPASVMYRDPSDDIAVLKGPQAPALRLAGPPERGSPLAVIGYPGGLPLVGVQAGVLSGLSVVYTLDEDRRPYVAITSTSGVSGMSGSPIVTPKGEVVSVLLFTICRNEQPICYVANGVSYQSVRRLMRMFGG